MSQVQQIILQEVGDTVAATGVVYLDYASGQTRNATAKKEVILSAGAMKTPQLLMLSVSRSALTTSFANFPRELVLLKLSKKLVYSRVSSTRILERSKSPRFCGRRS